MQLIDCRACGSRELVEVDGFVVCTYCRSKYSPPAQQVPRAPTVIALSSDIEALLQRCRDDPANSRRYAGLVLDMDPRNHEARRYLQ